MKQNRGVLFIPYFGQWPEWFDLYLYSCENVQLDFQFFTDCKIPEEHPDNVRFIATSFKEYDQVSKSLKIDFHPSSAYKLCDLKPFYGFIHKDLASKYDFWGFGDIDLIYGNMEELLSDRMLGRFDVITTHSDRIAGHFCIFRTGSRIAEKCFGIKDWQKKLMDDCHRNIDEADLTLAIYPEIRFSYKLFRLFERMGIRTDMNSFLDKVNPIFCNRLTHRHFKEYWTTPEPREGQLWKWHVHTGAISNTYGRSIPYLHFLFFKKNKYKQIDGQWNDGVFNNLDTQRLRNVTDISFSLNDISYE